MHLFKHLPNCLQFPVRIPHAGCYCGDAKPPREDVRALLIGQAILVPDIACPPTVLIRNMFTSYISIIKLAHMNVVLFQVQGL